MKCNELKPGLGVLFIPSGQERKQAYSAAHRANNITTTIVSIKSA